MVEAGDPPSLQSSLFPRQPGSSAPQGLRLLLSEVSPSQGPSRSEPAGCALQPLWKHPASSPGVACWGRTAGVLVLASALVVRWRRGLLTFDPGSQHRASKNLQNSLSMGLPYSGPHRAYANETTVPPRGGLPGRLASRESRGLQLPAPSLDVCGGRRAGGRGQPPVIQPISPINGMATKPLGREAQGASWLVSTSSHKAPALGLADVASLCVVLWLFTASFMMRGEP